MPPLRQLHVDLQGRPTGVCRVRILILLLALTLAGCEGDTILPAANPAAPSGGTTTVTNTTTVTVTIDRSDTAATPDSTPGMPTPTTGALPLPTYGEAEARAYAAAHPHQVTHSCQVTDGEAAWAFLDGLIGLLRQRDTRWGYLCKDASCSKVAADIVAYKASAGDTGFWIVDVLGNHCPNAGESPTQVRWGVLPFETVRRWSGTR
jgi:hypothetical protein